MFFSTINETILRETNESGPVWRFVYGSEKRVWLEILMVT